MASPAGSYDNPLSTRVCVSIHMGMHVCVSSTVRVCVHTRVRAYVCMSSRIQVSVHTHICVHACVYSIEFRPGERG